MERKRRKPAADARASVALEIRVLGDLGIVRAGRSVTLPASRKTRALLGFLALAPRQERRERLCDLFWDAPDDPRGSLRARGGEPLLAAQTCLRAGERCVRLFAFRDAADLAQRGLAYAAELPPATALPLRVRLLELHVHAGLPPDRQRALATTFLGLVDELEAARRDDDVHRCFAQIVRLEYLGGDFAGLHAQVSRGAEAPRAGDPAVAARALGASGACLAWLEDDLSRAHALLTEASALAGKAGIALSDLGRPRPPAVSRGRRDGRYRAPRGPCGSPSRRRILGSPTRRPCSSSSSIWRRGARARRAPASPRCRLASTFGHGSEEPVVESLACLTDLIDSDATAASTLDVVARVERAITALRAHDHKRMLAFVLARLAERAIAAGDLSRATSMVEEACAVADVLGRRSERLKARMIAARLAAARGDRSNVARLLADIDDDLNAPGGAAANLRVGAVRLRHELRKSFPLRRAP